MSCEHNNGLNEDWQFRYAPAAGDDVVSRARLER